MAGGGGVEMVGGNTKHKTRKRRGGSWGWRGKCLIFRQDYQDVLGRGVNFQQDYQVRGRVFAIFQQDYQVSVHRGASWGGVSWEFFCEDTKPQRHEGDGGILRFFSKGF